MRLLLFSLIALYFTGCTIVTSVEPEEDTPIEIYGYDTHFFPEEDLLPVMKALLNTFQDQGFIIRSAQRDLGLVTADMVIDLESYSNDDGIWVWYAPKIAKTAAMQPTDDDHEHYYTYEKLEIIESSAQVISYESGSKVQVNFQSIIVDNEGNVLEAELIEDESFYEEFFSLVHENIIYQYEY